MTYLNDHHYIMRHLPTERLEMVKASAYWNDYDAALEVLKHSSNVDREAVFKLVREALLKDINVSPQPKVL